LGASSFYGRIIVDMLDIAPRIPILLHYGARDASIPMSDIERVRAAAPDAEIFVYEEAGHGFCRKASADHHAPSRDLALARTLDVFNRITSGA
jgi:carboxymethylenebutenolidase